MARPQAPPARRRRFLIYPLTSPCFAFHRERHCPSIPVTSSLPPSAGQRLLGAAQVGKDHPGCLCLLPVEGDFEHVSARCVPNGRRTTTKKGVCTTKAFSVTRRLISILLTSLRLHACRCPCRADGGGSEVDGSDPPIFGPGSGAGHRCGNSAPPPWSGRSRLDQSLREGG